MSPADHEAQKPIRITWLGHSCYRIDSPDAVIVIDPFLEVPGYAKLDLQADLVLCSHEHDDHNARELVTLSGRQPLVDLEVLETFHDPEGGKLRGPNKIHILTLGGQRIAHLGDLGHDLSAEETDRLRNLQLLLIPVGGYYTIDAGQAARIVRETRPDVTVPMHYRDGGAGWDVTSGVEDFLDLSEKVVRHDQSTFALGDYHSCVLLLKNPKI